MSGQQQQPVTILAGIPVQTAISLLPVPIVYGLVRLAPNLIWYGAFSGQNQASGKGGGGKTPAQMSYTASVILSLCEGPIGGVLRTWQDKKLSDIGFIGLSLFDGAYNQVPWAYLTTSFPGQDLAYRGTAYVAQAGMPLTSQATVPNYKFELLGNLQIGGGASFNATINYGSNVLTVNSVSSGSIAVGQMVSDTSYATGNLPFLGEHITGQKSGTPGGVGEYYLSENSTLNLSENMTFYTNNAGYATPAWIVFHGTIATGSNVLTVDYIISGYGQFQATTWGWFSFIALTNILGWLTPGTSIVPGGSGTGGAGTYNLSATQWNTVQVNMTSQVVDCNPSDVITDYLTNANYGVPSFLSSYIGNWTQFSNYCLAQGLIISAALTNQESAISFINRVMDITNSDCYWSDGLLKITPRGDTAVTGNGVTYTPDLTPLFNLTDDNYVVTGASEPVKMMVSDPVDAYNDVTVNWTNRANSYNSQPLEVSDLNAINQFGLRKESSQSFSEICDANCAQVSAQLRLQRIQNFRIQYRFVLPVTFCMLEPTDLVTLSDSNLGMNNQLVRILSIDEDDKGNLDITAEEMNIGVANPSQFSHQATGGYFANYNQIPPYTNYPVIFAPPIQIALSTLELWLCASGPAGWGGCDVWISNDNATYKYLGRIIGGSRTGRLTAALPAGSDPDLTDTLSLDLTESQGQLTSGSQADADLYHTLCYVDGEVLSYETATLTGTNKYNLTYLRRGAYGSVNGAHANNTQFARLDGTQFDVPYTSDQIGKTIYIKLPAFNIYQGALQDLASVEPVQLVVPAPPLPSNVTGFGVTQSNTVVVFSWNQIPDYALKGYDIGFAPQGTTLWSGFEMLTEAAKGTEMTNAAVPPGTWVFGIRARDVADQLSPAITMVNRVITDANLNVIHDVEEIGWSGTLVGLVEHYTGVLSPISTNPASFYVAISPPPAPVLSAIAGGAIAATTYFVEMTYVTGSGETVPSTEASLAVAVNNVLQIAAPVSPPANAIGWNAYVSTTTGTETLQNATPIALGAPWTEPTTGLVSGAALPTANTTGWEVFNEWVPDPVTFIEYTTNTMDASYDENLRVYDTQNFGLGYGQAGSPAMQSFIDTWLTGATDPDVYTLWVIGFIIMRYIRGRISATVAQGELFYISDYTLVVDMAPVIETPAANVVISATGGTWTVFPQPYHQTPFVIPVPISSSGPVTSATASGVTNLGCYLHLWNGSTEVTGVASYTATGE